MKIVKCSFKNVTEEEKNKFQRSSCLLTISVGQEYHESEKFKSTITLINASFKNCKIMLYDTLQRYTMALVQNKKPEYFYDIAKQEGDLWLARNRKYFDDLDNLTEIIRWEHWLTHPDFASKKLQVMDLLVHDVDYKVTFEETIDQYLSRYQRRLENSDNFDYAKAHQLCFDYLVEECAALCVWPETECYVDVYPTPRNSAMDKTHRKILLKEYPGILHSVSLKFKNKKQLQGQKFHSQELNKRVTVT